MLKSTVLLLCLLHSLVQPSPLKDQPIEDVLLQLSDKIDNYQVLKPVDFKPTLPLPTWAKRRGLYESDIRINFAGIPALQELRSGPVTRVFDNDMFSTGWIVTTLLEANLYGKGAPVYNSYRLQIALEVLSTYNNKNDPNAAKSLLRTFWPQSFNKTTGVWFQEPINIRNLVEIVNEKYHDLPFAALEKLFRSVGLDKLADLVTKADKLDADALVNVFSIPPDFDDTYLNLGMGSTLSRLSDRYPDLYKEWLANNTDCKHLIDVTSKYAYRPFDDDLNKNTIDPRTFFFARKFVQEAKAADQPLSLITTWIQSVDEQREYIKNNYHISMPFNVNNVDVTVSANAIYGITSGSIDNINDFGTLFMQSDDMQQTYLNTTRFVAWAIQSNFSSRPDLAQVYYPSKYNFLWYTSRTLFLLENEFQSFEQLAKLNKPEDRRYLEHFSSMYHIFDQARSYLNGTFQGAVTDFLLDNQIKSESSDDEVYFCDFLGRDDKDAFGRKEPSKDDCLFTTAQSVNILIATWSVHQKKSGQLLLRANTPKKVVDLITQSVNWLKRNVLNRRMKAMNAFFSGSVKGYTSLPFWYPVNFIQFLNGTDVPVSTVVPTGETGQLINVVKGSIDEETYESMLKEKHQGKMTPIDFQGFNKDNFPFWSSEPYTYAVSLLALAQYNNLIVN